MKVLVFAQLRELLGSNSIELPDGDCPANVAALRLLLAEHVGGAFAEALADPNVFCAVDQRVVDDEHSLSPTQEIAFFPPMTGG